MGKKIKEIGEWIFIIGLAVLFFNTLDYLRKVAPINLQTGVIEPLNAVIFVVSIIFTIFGIFMMTGLDFKKYIKTNLMKLLEGYIAFILTVIASFLIGIVIISQTKYKIWYVLGILLVGFLFYFISDIINDLRRKT